MTIARCCLICMRYDTAIDTCSHIDCPVFRPHFIFLTGDLDPLAHLAGRRFSAVDVTPHSGEPSND